MVVVKELTFLEHEGNTKFYEIALFSCGKTKQHLTVRRWGKIGSKNNGGGELKFEYWSTYAEAKRNVTLVMSQRKGYHSTGLGSGLKSGDDRFEHDMLPTALMAHYNAPQVAATIMERLGLGAETILDEIDASHCETIAKPEPIRAADWASW